MRSKPLQEVVVPARILATLKVNGVHCAVTNLFDIDGDETTDLEWAEVAVVALPDGRWASLCITSTGVWPLS